MLAGVPGCAGVTPSLFVMLPCAVPCWFTVKIPGCACATTSDCSTDNVFPCAPRGPITVYGVNLADGAGQSKGATRTIRHGIAEPIMLKESIRSCIEWSSDSGGTASTDDIRPATEWAFKVRSR